jgi:VanZ family protein
MRMFKPDRIITLSKFRTHVFDLAAMILAVAITIGSLIPLPPMHTGQGSDKVFHLAAYGLLAVLALVQRQSYRAMLIVIIAIVMLGLMIEFIQPFTGRQREVADLMANAAGTLIGALLALFLRNVKPTSPM